MFLLDDTVVTSASDLTAASHCEFAWLRRLDRALGRDVEVVTETDAMLERTGRLGDAHELRVLEAYRRAFGAGVVEIDRPDVRSREALETAASASAEALRTGAPIVFQATFFDGEFVGFADFLEHRSDDRGASAYRVQDTKLARSARVTALLQVAAYAEQLERIGIPVDPVVELLLGDGRRSVHRLVDIAPVYRQRRVRLRALIAERLADAPVAWGDERYPACGHCGTCEAEVQARRDVLLVAGIRPVQRAALARAAVTTIEQLAERHEPVEGMTAGALGTLRAQARLQLAPHGAHDAPAIDLFAPHALASLPMPDAGDLFFDFEGDPLYTEPPGTIWGLDYLFGMVDTDSAFTAFWAHSFAEERQALVAFLALVRERRATHPALHIYHYAPYERTHLATIAARHGVGEAEVDALLREHVLVDLYPLVRQSLRVGSRSYSLKKLEPLYMGDEFRASDVTNAADSITAYAELRQLRDEGDGAGDAAEAERMLAEIGDYNAYDCRSTLMLRDWLLARAAERGIHPGTQPEREETGPDPDASALHDALLALGGDPLDPARDADATALHLAAAAIDYHRREAKSFWWAHFSRLLAPRDELRDLRDVFVADEARVIEDWHRPPRARIDRRTIWLGGEVAPGSSFRAEDAPYVLHEYPGPFVEERADAGARATAKGTVLEVTPTGILIEERLPAGVEPYADAPSMLTPGPPPGAGTQVGAIAEWGQAIVDAAPGLPDDPVLDLLRRRAPRTRTGPLAIAAHPDDTRDALTASLLDLGGSYLAVQGPPGTGKTYLASHVIARLVTEHGWRIGVVAQSHAVVENLLRSILTAGLPRDRVGKGRKQDDKRDSDELPFSVTKDFATFLDDHEDGCVIGGTAWTFSNAAQVPRRSLDLLVVDEAGQFSLAYTIAAGVAARNLLLLGDPQQLPQVSQGTHPEPVDGSALGWIADGHDVLPAEYGYFLAESRRMHPAVADAVSRLSYEGALHAHPTAAERKLSGIAPGVHAVPVPSVGCATANPAEAAEVVRIVRDVLGRAWSDPSAGPPRSGPLEQEDVIVVAPYNAHVAVVREALDAAGYDRVPVGSVDKFQGQEAAVAIVTLAASTAEDAPRGLGFLLLRNRLNVAVSRAQWAAFVVHSPLLVDHLPRTPDGVAELSAFLTLLGE